MASTAVPAAGSGDHHQPPPPDLDDADLREILATGTDLRQYSAEIERAFADVERRSIDDYIGESQNIASLHNQIGECDGILERMEAMLVNFQVGPPRRVCFVYE